MSPNDKDYIEKLEIKIDHLSADVTHLLFIMQSDPKTNERGLVERVRGLEKSLNNLLHREDVYKAKGAVWGVVGGSIVAFGVFVGKVLLTKIF